MTERNGKPEGSVRAVYRYSGINMVGLAICVVVAVVWAVVSLLSSGEIVMRAAMAAVCVALLVAISKNIISVELRPDCVRFGFMFGRTLRVPASDIAAVESALGSTAQAGRIQTTCVTLRTGRRIMVSSRIARYTQLVEHLREMSKHPR